MKKSAPREALKARQRQLLARVEEKGKVAIQELVEWLGVSGVTVRKDLTELAAAGYLSRSHGFAVSLNDLNERVGNNYPVKASLAERAVTLLEDGDSVFIEAGSSNAHFARVIARTSLDITVITPCLYIANELKNARQDVVLIGGVLQKRSECMIGPLAHQAIAHINFNKVFIGVDGFTEDAGFTGRDVMRAETIRLAIAKNVQNYVIAEAAKFGKLYPYTVASPRAIDTVVTDASLPAAVETLLKQYQVQVLKTA